MMSIPRPAGSVIQSSLHSIRLSTLKPNGAIIEHQILATAKVVIKQCPPSPFREPAKSPGSPVLSFFGGLSLFFIVELIMLRISGQKGVI